MLCAWAHWPDGGIGFTALTLYFNASHHGKVRTTLRSTGDGSDLFGLRAGDEPLLLAGFTDTPYNIDPSRKCFAGRGAFELASPHRDPFDRLLGAQAILEKADLVTADPAFRSFQGLNIVW